MLPSIAQFLAAVLVAAFLLGCEKKTQTATSKPAQSPSLPSSPIYPEPTYQGTSLSQWIKLADDRDGQTQSVALSALSNFKGNAEAKAAIGRHLKDPTPGVRLEACSSWFYIAGDKGPALAFLQEQVSRGNVEPAERFYAAMIVSRLAVIIGKTDKPELMRSIQAIEAWKDPATNYETENARLFLGEPLPRSKNGFIGLE